MAAKKLKLFHQFGKKIIGIGMNYRYVTFMCDGHCKVYHLKLSVVNIFKHVTHIYIYKYNTITIPHY
jgi:hypothetical protein